jgi:hypothetical protein
MGLRQEAINTQAELMREARSELVRQKAAESLMKELAQPDENNINLKIGMDAESKSMQEDLNEQLAKLAFNQSKLLEQGHSISDVQKIGINLNIEDVEVVDNE